MRHFLYNFGFDTSVSRERRMVHFAGPEKNEKQFGPLSENATKILEELMNDDTNKQEIADEIKRSLMADGKIDEQDCLRHVNDMQSRLMRLPSVDKAVGIDIKDAINALPKTPADIVNFAVERGLFTPAELMGAQEQGVLRRNNSSPSPRKATEGRMSPIEYQKDRPVNGYDPKTKEVIRNGQRIPMAQFRAFMQSDRANLGPYEVRRNTVTGQGYTEKEWKNLQILRTYHGMRGGGGDMARDYSNRKANMQKYAGVDIGHNNYFPREMNPVSLKNSSLSRVVPPSADVSQEQQSSGSSLERWPENERRKFEETPNDGQWHKIDAGVKGYLYAIGKDGQLYAFNSVNKDISRFRYLPPNNRWAYLTPKAAETVAGLIAPDASTQKLATDALANSKPAAQSDKITVQRSKIEDPSAQGGFSRVVKTWMTGAEQSNMNTNTSPETIGTPEWFKPLYNDAKNQAAIKENAVVRRGDAWPSMPTTFIDGIYEVPSPNTRPGELPMPFVNYSGWHMPPGRFDLNGMTPEQQQHTIARLQNPYSNQEEALRLHRAGRGASKSLPKMKSYEERPAKMEASSDKPPMMDLPPATPKQAPAPTPPDVPESELPPAPAPDFEPTRPNIRDTLRNFEENVKNLDTPSAPKEESMPKSSPRRSTRSRSSSAEEPTSADEKPAETETRKSAGFEIDEE